MSDWVLVLFANLRFLEKAITTMEQCRTIGQWTDSIVFITDIKDTSTIVREKTFQQWSEDLGFEIRRIETPNTKIPEEFWKNHPTHEQYNYIQRSFFQYAKFHVIDTYFRKWKYVFYIDSGMNIYKPLHRFKKSCVPNKCFYAHSDSYPTIQKNLLRQYAIELDPDLTKKLIQRYGASLYNDNFQSTMFIYDTAIIENDMKERLFEMMDEFPFVIRGDQGIWNLLIHCEKKLWKPIPVKDDEGWLYDFWQRWPYNPTDYIMTKYT